MIHFYAWCTPPQLDEIQKFFRYSSNPTHLIICLDGKRIPYPNLSQSNTWQKRLSKHLHNLQFNTIHPPIEIAPQLFLWFVPKQLSNHLAEYFPIEYIHWQTNTPIQKIPPNNKPWYTPPPIYPAEHVAVIGAGIAGAATAYELARLGIRVSVLEKASMPATAASGNRQGLLYAKISPHYTEQTELLLIGYSYMLGLLNHLLPHSNAWGGNGLLHLNHNEAESRRHRALGQHSWHTHLYRTVSALEASNIAGIPILQDALYWPNGVWLNPATVIHTLLSHPNITFYPNTPLISTKYTDHWHIMTPKHDVHASHIVFCTGANSKHTPLIGDFPFRMIRGQTAVADATLESKRLKTSLSGASYITPAWNEQHCYGASFVMNDEDDTWRTSEDTENYAALAQLNSFLAEHTHHTGTGHTAIRCDSSDHLPVVGALGNPHLMRQYYKALALDKNRHIDAPCPYWHNTFANTAHGSRGLITAPICAAEIAAQICGTPHFLSSRLRTALNPNRLIIREIIKNHF